MNSLLRTLVIYWGWNVDGKDSFSKWKLGLYYCLRNHSYLFSGHKYSSITTFINTKTREYFLKVLITESRLWSLVSRGLRSYPCETYTERSDWSQGKTRPTNLTVLSLYPSTRSVSRSVKRFIEYYTITYSIFDTLFTVVLIVCLLTCWYNFID